ncbi:metallophosphoesterase family protein [Algivirga pacifica]|uniref:Metallophosphoesterase family protein n=1 Tax=Algivirga pacifica TaxID=1162670 RepID=A0ABP9DF38_9BACT
MNTFVLSDIHGCNLTLQKALQNIGLKEGDELIFLGDYIDRGPDSKGVIDTILHLKASGYQVHCLKGNHEEMMLQAFYDTNVLKGWLRNGGDTTLDSFGIQDLSDLDRQYIVFLMGLSVCYTKDNFLFVHAGLNFEVADPMSDLFSMLWIRNWYEDINYHWLEDRYIIHGHTPRPIDELKTMLDNLPQQRYLNLDSGCIYTERPGHGHLSVLHLNSMQLHLEPCVEAFTQ